MLLALQIVLGIGFAGTGIGMFAKIAKDPAKKAEMKEASGKKWAQAMFVGVLANFVDTLGCGSFAPSTFMYKAFGNIEDINIPGTLNVGDTFPVIFEALIFTASIECDPVFLISMLVAAAVGSFSFATIVTKWDKQKIRIGMSICMLACIPVMLCRNFGFGPFGEIGTAIGLTGWKFILAVVLNVLWGALMDIGFGLYAPCMATCLMLGVNGSTCFPVFMGSCALLMPCCSIEFIKTGRFDSVYTIGNFAGGMVGVFIAWKFVTNLSMFWVVNLVCAVLLWTSYTMLHDYKIDKAKAANA